MKNKITQQNMYKKSLHIPNTKYIIEIFHEINCVFKHPFTFVKTTIISYKITVDICDRTEKIIKKYLY